MSAATTALVRRLATLWPDLDVDARREIAEAGEVHRPAAGSLVDLDDRVLLVTAGRLVLRTPDGDDLVAFEPGASTTGTAPRGTCLAAGGRATLLALPPDALADILRAAPDAVHEQLTLDANRLLLATHL